MKLLMRFLTLLMLPTVTFAISQTDPIEPTKEASDNCYAISIPNHLYWFAQAVNGGQTDLCGKLTADITVNSNVLKADGSLNEGDFVSWTPIGNFSKPFRGEFKGQGHSISGLYFSGDNTFNLGLFGNTNKSVESDGIENCVDGSFVIIDRVAVKDSYFNGLGDIGGIAGNASCTKITNSYAEVSIHWSSENPQSSGFIGGLVGDAFSTTIENSYSVGFLSGAKFVGGVVGYSRLGKFNNSYSIATVEGTKSVGGFVGDSYRDSYENCYSNSLNGNAENSSGSVLVASDKAFSSGLVAVALHKGNDGGVWGQDLAGGDVYPKFTDKLPVSGSVSYKIDNGYFVFHSFDFYVPGMELPKVAREEYVFEGWFTDAEFKNLVTHVPSDATGNLTYYAKWKYALVVAEDGCYEIDGRESLYLFAKKINGGETDACGRLTNDVTVNLDIFSDAGCKKRETCRVWTPIGNQANKYYGRFNGQNHVVKGLFVDDENLDNVGLFGYVGNGVVESVGIESSYFHGANNVGGLAGYTNNERISDVYSTAIAEGNEHVGGLIGYLDGGSTTNAYSIATVSGTKYVGGFAGSAYDAKVANSYSLSTVSATGRSDIFAEDSHSDYDNCFVLGVNKSTTQPRNGLYFVSNVPFENGLVAASLHSWCEKDSDGEKCADEGKNGALWGQDIANGETYPHFVDKLPGFNKIEYRLNGGFFKEKAFESYIPGMELPKPLYLEYKFLGWYDNENFNGEPLIQIPSDATGELIYFAKWEKVLDYDESDKCYAIKDADGLYAFAEIVNEDMAKASICGKLVDDIVVNEKVLGDDGCKKSGTCRVWTPIGRSPIWMYSGDFNGQGHVIKGLFFDAQEDFVGLFGFTLANTIKNVGVEDSYLHGNNYVGSIVGHVDQSSIYNTYTKATVTGNKNVGGLVGFLASMSTLSNNYSWATVEAVSDYGNFCGTCFGSAEENNYDYLSDEKTLKDGSVAVALHSWCEKDKSGECKEGGVNGSVWGQYVGHEDYPAFTNVVKFDIAYNLNGGKLGDAYAKTYAYGEGLELPVPTRGGYEFGGWYETSDFSGSSVKALEATSRGKKTFYAKWLEIFAITVAVNDTKMGSAIGSGNYAEGKSVELEAVAKDGYVFSNWEDDVKAAAKRTVTVTENKQYKAVFKVADSSSSAGSSSSGNATSSSSDAKPASSSGKDAVVAMAVPQFRVSVAGHSLQVAGAKVGSAYAVLDMQGRVLNWGRVEVGNFNVILPSAGSYLVRIGNQTQHVSVK